MTDADTHMSLPSALYLPGIGEPTPAMGRVAIESPLQLLVNESQVACLMRTPGDDEDLAWGFLYSTGILRDPSVSPLCDLSLGDPDSIDVSLPDVAVCLPECAGELGTTRMMQAAREAASLDDAAISTDTLSLNSIAGLFQLAGEHGMGLSDSGGKRAAVFGSDGACLARGLDVNAGNAVDKVIGRLLHEERMQEAICLVVFADLDVQVVAKAARSRWRFCCGTGQPTSLAVQVAAENGVTLVGDCQQGRCTIYSHPEGVTADPNASSQPMLKAIDFTQA